MATLQWLQVNKFRSVQAGTRLKFSSGHNVLLGQNGAGKTTLLNIISAAIRYDFGDFKNEEFDFEYEVKHQKTKLLVSARNQRSNATPDAELNAVLPQKASEALKPNAKSGRPTFFAKVQILSDSDFPQVTFTFDEAEGSLHLQTSSTTQPLKSGAPVDTSLWVSLAHGLSAWIKHIENSENKKPDRDLIAQAVIAIYENLEAFRLDESLDYFRRILKSDITITREPDGKISLTGTNTPQEIADHLKSIAHTNWSTDKYTLTKVQLPFLDELAKLFGFDEAEAIFEVEETTKANNLETQKLAGLRFVFIRRGIQRITEKKLSYGQKRILSFLHYLSCAESVVIADELVNGLHHSWIEICFEKLRNLQTFLTSQNPLLLDYLSFEMPSEIQSTFILCRWIQGDDQMSWENPTQEVAENFYESYKFGFQQVGELLQVKGLW